MIDSRRLFFALWPEPPVRRALMAARGQLPAFDGRAAHPLDLHVTLVFLGAVSTEQEVCVEAVADGIRAEPFELAIDCFGYWSKPRILWCGPNETPQALGALVADLRAGLRHCGFEPERRSYAPHVTLAREALKIHCPDLTPPVAWPVREFALVASRSAGPPPRYELLRSWTLGG